MQESTIVWSNEAETFYAGASGRIVHKNIGIIQARTCQGVAEPELFRALQ